MNLTPEQRAWVDAVVRPLGDDASRRELLEESLMLTTTLTVPPEGDPVEAARARMEATAGSFSFRLRRTRRILAVDEDWMIAALWLPVVLPFAWLIVLATGHLWGSVERRLHRAIEALAGIGVIGRPEAAGWSGRRPQGRDDAPSLVREATGGLVRSAG